MANLRVWLLANVLFMSLLITMQWFATEQRWYSGIIIFGVLSAFILRRVLIKNESTFNDAVGIGSAKKAVFATLRMWFKAQGYFLLVAFVYYILIALVDAIYKSTLEMSIEDALVSWALKLVGLAFSNLIFVPIVCVLAFIVYSQGLKTINKKYNDMDTTLVRPIR